jgi:glycosyltransferase involved in cell wall biosynthesis
MKIAFVFPHPPAATGIADYSVEVLRALAPGHDVTAFHGPEAADAGALPEGVALRPAAALLETAASDWDAIFYQLGNGPAHDFLYPLMAARPGIVVLHDLVLHHARGRALLDGPAVRAYRAAPGDAALQAGARQAIAEYAALVESVYPGRGARLAAVQLGTSGHLLPYAWPLFEDVARAARGVVVHNAFMAREVAAAAPGVPVTVVPHPARREPVRREDVAALRASLGQGEFAVGAFGLLSAEKRIETVARAVARVRRHRPRTRLLLVGPVPDRGLGAEPRPYRGVSPHGTGDGLGPASAPDVARLRAQLAIAGLAPEATIVTGRVPLETLALHVEAADAVAHLRWPTARETSGALLRVLAQGRPTVIADLEHLAEIPAGAVLRADVTDEEGELFRALLRLHDDGALRERLGAAARAWTETALSPAATRAGYLSAARSS